MILRKIRKIRSFKMKKSFLSIVALAVLTLNTISINAISMQDVRKKLPSVRTMKCGLSENFRPKDCTEQEISTGRKWLAGAGAAVLAAAATLVGVSARTLNKQKYEAGRKARLAEIPDREKIELSGKIDRMIDSMKRAQPKDFPAYTYEIQKEIYDAYEAKKIDSWEGNALKSKLQRAMQELNSKEQK